MAKLKYADWPAERKARKAAYDRKWKANRSEKQKARDRESARKTAAKYRKNHPERARASTVKSHKKWRVNNPELAREKDRIAVAKYRAKYPEKAKAYLKKWRARNQARIKANNTTSSLRRYGLTLAEYDKFVVEQENCCAICKTVEPGGRGRWHVDHCHETGVVRGLLCSSCNVGLGHFRHEVGRLKAALAYLGR